MAKNPNWNSKSVASEFKHKVFYFLIKFGGRPLAYILLYCVVTFYTFVPSLRRRSSYYIEKRFPGLNFFQRFARSFKLNLTLGKTLVDRAVLGITGEINILSSKEDQDLCARLYAQGKGLIVITAHCGCWQSAMSTFDFMEGEKYVIYRRIKEDVDKQAHEHGKTKQTVKFIDPAGYAGGALDIMGALEKNAIICMMGDRVFGGEKNLCEVNFLGSPIKVPAGIYRMAAAFSTPVVVVFFPFKGAGKFDSVIAANFTVEDKGADIKNYTPYAQIFADKMEEFCKDFPYQFFNFYNIWEK
ncbi:putative LPLAT superfamily acyltransferase [Elusimicrobium posterum]|uniref:LpxL/LpxP family acyltransferase n=1 Tax=Elusimicrobium posterum TaxID=3116653 RepID=UPI003C714CBB